MSWVSPIKDKETLQKFENGLKAAGEKYYVLFEIGLGTGLKMPGYSGTSERRCLGKGSPGAEHRKENYPPDFQDP